METNLEQPTKNQVSSEVQTDELNLAQSEGSKTQTEEAQLGKFKDAKSLFVAYQNLQSDYTKKCQTLANLQKDVREKQEENAQNAGEKEEEKLLKEKFSSLDKDTLLQEYIFQNEELKNKILTKYFDEINLPKSPKLMGSDRGSGVVISPAHKPKTLAQAEGLVREMFDKK